MSGMYGLLADGQKFLRVPARWNCAVRVRVHCIIPLSYCVYTVILVNTDMPMMPGFTMIQTLCMCVHVIHNSVHVIHNSLCMYNKIKWMDSSPLLPWVIYTYRALKLPASQASP